MPVPAAPAESYLDGTALFGQALYQYGSTWLDRHGDNLYVVACSPDYDQHFQFAGCTDQKTVKLARPEPDIVLASAPWRINGLVKDQQYWVVLFEDVDQDAEWDWSNTAEGRLQWPPPSDPNDLVWYPPRQGIALRYDPPVPPGN